MNAQMLDTEATSGTQAAWREDGLGTGHGWRAQAPKHLGNDGEIEPVPRRGNANSVLVHPWVADGDKNDARPLNGETIHVLVRPTGEAPYCAGQREYALPHKPVTVVAEGDSKRIRMAITPDHDAPFGMLAATKSFGGQPARAQGLPSWRADAGGSRAWTEN